jgi:hypothetical protein
MSVCSECGAPVPAGGACLDHFHAMLALEHEVARDAAEAGGGRGELAHFHAVSAYGLQHPAGMAFTKAALDGLIVALVDQLAGRATLEDVRRRARRGAREAGGVRRRPEDPPPVWPVRRWPVTVTDVLAGGVPGYCARAEAWARSVVEALSAKADVSSGG